jgi:hypothetical protein
MMGLDVYLYRYERAAEEIEAEEAAYEAESERVWAEVGGTRKYDEMSEAERDAASTRTKAYALAHGLDERGSAQGRVKIEEPSAKYPDHYFKIGYFRSSYNSGGIDRILSDRIGLTLSDLFNADKRYSFAPNWETSLARTRQAITDFRAYLDRFGSYRVIEVSAGFGGGVASEADALAVFHEQRHQWLARPEGERKEMCAYSNNSGAFYFGDASAKMVALFVNPKSFLGPSAYAVVEANGSDEWYVHALEIVVETIEWVMAQPDRERYRLHWSS